MITLDSLDFFPKATWLNTDFPTLVIDDFISDNVADSLVNDGSSFISSEPNGSSVIHGGRTMIPWTSNQFKRLLLSSDSWKSFSESFEANTFSLFKENLKLFKFNSPYSEAAVREFSKSVIASFDSYRISSRLLRKEPYEKYLNAYDYTIRSQSPSKLAVLSMWRLADSYWRRLISLINFFRGGKPLIPLFDYSYSNQGYSREIHRDSDNRLLVVLLYLNNLDKHAEGGDLEIFKFNRDKLKKNQIDMTFPPQPSLEESTLQYIIKPRRGRLVMFLNQCNSYHAVSSMKNHSFGRHFIYGGFTFPSSIFLSPKRLSDLSLKTEMHIY